MPGRSAPRRPVRAAQGTHLQGAFKGALDGASTLPAPVGEESREGIGKKSPVVYFHQDRFTMSGGFQKLSLTYVPIANSEHAYRLRGGASGRGLLQNAAWRSTGDGRTIEVLTGANTVSGDVLVVEYAYYEQAPSPAAPAPTWFDIVAEGAPILNGGPGIWYPEPVARPGDFPSGVSADWSSLKIFAPQATAMSVPGIAPGSTYARQGLTIDGFTVNALYQIISVYAGAIRPKWSTTTYHGANVWFQEYGEFPVQPTDRKTFLRTYFEWPSGSTPYFNTMHHEVYYSFLDNLWHFNALTEASAVWSECDVVLSSLSNILRDGAVHYLGFSVNCATQSVEVRYDGTTQTISHPAIWPSAAAFSAEVYHYEPEDTSAILNATLWNSGVSKVTSDLMTIRTNPTWAAWG